MSLTGDVASTAVVADGCMSGLGLRAAVALRAGAVLLDLAECAVAERPTIHTVQTGVDEHVDGPTIRYLNHSCAPNTHIDVAAGKVVALRPIEVGEELTFFYPSTEWEMVGPFVCQCGTPDCIRLVTGAKELSEDVLGRYRLNEHILALLARRDRDGGHAASDAGQVASLASKACGDHD
ncbi:SET domain-containing protein [Streptoalloteichus tenebrarius]|uniref:SET domain-containing protein n=1 Tax=Streptoalloteichus tenebrarius (strain ATCC 17920 / DSM 40477 / JCM 4838 / CBS 697.72 / NBRC 16177 / NCIMB 11028 / NRRL B-12390 / A12253. 1 / ISP 5477) TaxID=1933 RepID=A0ABT1HU53_STRSD|nr:SET domain-containing protein-lysine N-methyltransferase [Streptoalloteichus tenebrarius]MCP2259044.1 SET domain-containing protein [Streptoalloteichus tenebrarius]BFE99630.1 hypothetical protein GCM10020241_13060 [Streptoalloteichus tenebrarius]